MTSSKSFSPSTSPSKSKYLYKQTDKTEINEQGQKCNLVECGYCGRIMRAGGIRSHQFYKHGVTQ